MGCDNYDQLKVELEAERLRRFQTEDVVIRYQRVLMEIAEDFGTRGSELALKALELTRGELEEFIDDMGFGNDETADVFSVVDLRLKKQDGDE